MEIDDRDPPWMNDFIKNKIKQKIKAFKLYKNNRMGNNFSNLENLLQDLSELITKTKKNNKLLKTIKFYNGNKMSLIPLIIVNDKLDSDYEEKTNHLNKFFAFQCTPTDNDLQISDSFVFNTEAKFSSITCEDNDILKIIRNLDISKTHCFDDTSIRMVKLCDGPLIKPLSKIFQNCINSGVFPDSRKKSNIVPIRNKNGK